MERFDLVVIGAGPGGYVAAIRASQLGLKCALVEKRSALGGTCLNVGCIPSKALLESSHQYHAARESLADFGVKIAGVEMDLEAMMARKVGIVGDLTGGISQLMKKNKVSVYQGEGILKTAGCVRVVGEESLELEARSVLLATGSLPVEIPSLPFDGEIIVDSTAALCFDSVPKNMVVVGGGAIGLELGSVWMRLGAKVTVVEMLDRIAPFADKMASQMLARFLKKQGMDIRAKTAVKGAEITDGRAVVQLEDKKGNSESITCDKLLVAVGRRACSEGLGLEGQGIEKDEAGRVKVDADYATNIPGVYAIGDLIAGPMLAHKAEEEGVAVAEIISGGAGHVDYRLIPSVVYTHPELAQVGLTEEEAKEKGFDCKTGKFFYKANGRAKSMGEEDGLVKIVADGKSDLILGVHIVGAQASELIAEAVAAMAAGMKVEDLGRMVHAHPTLSEILKEAALAVHTRAIHG